MVIRQQGAARRGRRTLFAAAEKAGRDLYYEAAVAGAIPILRPLRESLAGDQVTRVLGIVNGTTNFILDQMDTTGAGFAEALEEAQELGYAEADPTADVEGFDAAAKAAILASLAFHTRVTAADVHREGITEVTAGDVASAAGDGLRRQAARDLRARGRSRRPAVSARVHPAMIPRSHPLASVREAFNAVFVESEAAGQLMFYGPGAGGAPTASAVLGDLVTVARNRLDGRPRRRRVVVRRPARCCRWGTPRPATTCRSTSTTRPACSPRWRQAFAEHDVSIQTVRQEGRGDDAQLVVVSHRASDADLAATVETLRGMANVREVSSVMRVEGDHGMSRQSGSGAACSRSTATASTSPRAPRPSPCARAAPRWSSRPGSPHAHRCRGLAQGRGRQPHRLLQGPRHDRGALGRRRPGRRGRGLRLDRQHLGLDGGVRRPGRRRSRSCWCPRARSRPASSPRRSCTARR